MTSSSSKPLIEVHNLEVRFKEQEVLRGLELKVEAGQIAGIRGPNGSGKTTLVNVLLGLQDYSGQVRVLGHNPRRPLEPAARPGVLLSEDGLYEQLSAKAQLELHARMFGLAASAARGRIGLLAEALKLDAHLRERPATWSSGMRRRLALARCFLLDKPLYVLDEPERGLDTQGRDWLEHKLDELKDSGASALVISHDAALLDAVCDELYLLEEGRLQARRRSRSLLKLWSAEPERLQACLEEQSGVLWLTVGSERLECGLESFDVALKILAGLPRDLARRAEVRW